MLKDIVAANIVIVEFKLTLADDEIQTDCFKVDANQDKLLDSFSTYTLYCAKEFNVLLPADFLKVTAVAMEGLQLFGRSIV